YPVTRNVLKSVQIDPDNDVKWVAVGNGVPAGVALDRSAIDALAYYDTGFGQIEAAGIGMQFLARPKDLPMVGGQFLMAKKSMLKDNRDLLVGYGRSVSKASQFLLADPAAGAKAFLEMYPETAPRGSSAEEAVKAVLVAIGRRGGSREENETDRPSRARPGAGRRLELGHRRSYRPTPAA